MFQFHAKTVALLPSVPPVSLANAKLLAARETELGLRWPESLREWYSLEGAVDILRQYSNADRPVPIDRLGAPLSPWYGAGRLGFVAQSLLLIMQENQGVCYWAVQLDGSADPPVVVTVDTAPCEVWLPLAPSFSEFVYCQIWDYAPMSARCEAQEPEFTPETLAFLRSKFQEGPATYGWPGSQNYRFTTPWGRLLIWHADNSGADWFLRASNHGDLEHLLCAVWQCGTLTKTLRGYDHEGEACLQRVRRVKVT